MAGHRSSETCGHSFKEEARLRGVHADSTGSWTTHHVWGFFLRFYLLIHDRLRERGRDIDRRRSRLSAGSPMRDSIPGSWDYDLSQRQTLNY